MIKLRELAVIETDMKLFALLEQQQSPSILKKEMEIELIQLAEKYKAKGLDFAYFTIDTSQKGIIDARVTLNEATDLPKQTSDIDTTNKGP